MKLLTDASGNLVVSELGDVHGLGDDELGFGGSELLEYLCVGVEGVSDGGYGTNHGDDEPGGRRG